LVRLAFAGADFREEAPDSRLAVVTFPNGQDVLGQQRDQHVTREADRVTHCLLGQALNVLFAVALVFKPVIQRLQGKAPPLGRA
jgi:hypothetical protein